ncbi:hypothetical protein Barb6_02211 [Bacteroidales bacterium Barb6]|nr:hypothetical protein Barb6_02211 [Bacteroidales bacterium Barb6]
MCLIGIHIRLRAGCVYLGLLQTSGYQDTQNYVIWFTDFATTTKLLFSIMIKP